MRVAAAINLSDPERRKLQRLSRARSSALRVRERAEIVLLAADGLLNKQIAQQTGSDPGKVGRWRNRYAEQGLEGIMKDKTRPGRIPPISPSLRSEIIDKTLTETPVGATHWSQASMAREAGVSPATVGRIWAASTRCGLPSGATLITAMRSSRRSARSVRSSVVSGFSSRWV